MIYKSWRLLAISTKPLQPSQSMEFAKLTNSTTPMSYFAPSNHRPFTRSFKFLFSIFFTYFSSKDPFVYKMFYRTTLWDWRPFTRIQDNQFSIASVVVSLIFHEKNRFAQWLLFSKNKFKIVNSVRPYFYFLIYGVGIANKRTFLKCS